MDEANKNEGGTVEMDFFLTLFGKNISQVQILDGHDFVKEKYFYSL